MHGKLGECYKIYDTQQARLKQPQQERVYYKEFWANKNISLEIRRGEAVGIVGSNGSGKSTFLQMICGTLTPTTGTVTTKGRLSALLELGAGFNPEFSGMENIYLNSSILGLSQGETSNELENRLSFAGRGDFINQPVKSY